MELTTTSALGAARLGIQIVQSDRRPILEIFEHVQNDMMPPENIPITDFSGKIIRNDQHRRQEFAVHFFLANIGSRRAENVNIKLSGDFKRERPFENWPESLRREIPQMAPGQTRFLFTVRLHDFLQYSSEKFIEGQKVSQPIGPKQGLLSARIQYNSSAGFWIGAKRLWTRTFLCHEADYTTHYTFDPSAMSEEFPPPNYQ